MSCLTIQACIFLKADSVNSPGEEMKEVKLYICIKLRD